MSIIIEMRICGKCDSRFSLDGRYYEDLNYSEFSYCEICQVKIGYEAETPYITHMELNEFLARIMRRLKET